MVFRLKLYKKKMKIMKKILMIFLIL